MREIKFRAWNTEFKQWLHRDAYLIAIQCFLASAEGVAIGESDLQNVVWMQYTGLKDKSGVEIYEGDIIARRFGIGELEKQLKLPVEWSDELTGFATKHPSGGRPWFLEKDGDYYVVGNIYESERSAK